MGISLKASIIIMAISSARDTFEGTYQLTIAAAVTHPRKVLDAILDT